MAGKTIRVFAKKAFRLELGDVNYTTRPMEFQSIPEVLTKCRLFRLAKDDGDIQIIATPKTQKAVEKEPGTPSRGNAGEGKTGTPVEGTSPDGDNKGTDIDDDKDKDKQTETGK